MTIFSPLTVFAKERKVAYVNISVKSNVLPNTYYGEEDVQVTVNSGKCTFERYDINCGEKDSKGDYTGKDKNGNIIDKAKTKWKKDEIPCINLYFSTEDDYKFVLAKDNPITIDGAVYVKHAVIDTKKGLKITVQLPSTKEGVGESTKPVLSADGYAVWDPIPGAASYEMRLRKNGQYVKATDFTSTEAKYSFKKYMKEAAAYEVMIRGVNGQNPNNKSDWEVSDQLLLTWQQAKELKGSKTSQETQQ